MVDGYGLLHELMADVVEDLSGQVSKNNERVPASGPAGGLVAADTWLMVSSVSSEVCRSNAAGATPCFARMESMCLDLQSRLLRLLFSQTM